MNPGGRIGIVLPNGHFENASMECLREYIKDKAFVIGVVLLHQETFVPMVRELRPHYCFCKRKYGTPIYRKDENGEVIKKNGHKLIDEDFTESVNDYRSFLQTFSIDSNKSFSINSHQLNSRFDYNYYSPSNRTMISCLKKSSALKLAKIADIVKTKSPLLKQNILVEYIELSNVHTKSFEIINSTTLLTAELPSRATYEIRNGDIITAVAGNSIGSRKHATAYVTEEFDKAICTNGFRVLRNFKVNPYYLLYYLQTELFLKQVFMFRTGAAIPALSDKDFANILVYLPRQKEMDDIVLSMKNSFKLRNDAKNEISKIKTEINIKHITNYCD